MSCRGFLLTMANICSSWWPLCYFSSSMSAVVRNPASSLCIVPSRLSISPLAPFPHQKYVQVKHNTEEIVHKLFNFKSFQGNSFRRKRVLRNFWEELLAEKRRSLCTVIGGMPSPGESGSTRLFRWQGELFHDAFPTRYGLQTCLFLVFG